MLRTHEYVIGQLTKRVMELLLHPTEVRYFTINGCNHYMCWLDEKRIAFGSGVIEVCVTSEMSKHEINSLFATYINSFYSDKISYYFWRKIRTMSKLKEEAPWFNMWNQEV